MLKELSHYENLGTPGFFWEMLRQINDSDTHWTSISLSEHFFNRILDGESVFDGCVPMAKAIGVLHTDEKEGLKIDSSFKEFLVSETFMRAKILERILISFGDDADFQLIFSSEYLSYDIVYNLIQVDQAAFGFKHSNFRKFLISFGFLSQHPDSKIKRLVVPTKYRRLFDMRLVPEVKRHKIGIGNLQANLEQKRIAGVEAEEFVVRFEKVRLSTHPKPETIQRISDYDVGAGYDVVSYEDVTSEVFTRFIEVKSCSIDHRFFWSKNEVLQARLRKNQYFLYLVDPKKIGKADYIPLIIQNPYDNVFLDKSWTREEQSWLFTKQSK